MAPAARGRADAHPVDKSTQMEYSSPSVFGFREFKTKKLMQNVKSKIIKAGGNSVQSGNVCAFFFSLVRTMLIIESDKNIAADAHSRGGRRGRRARTDGGRSVHSGAVWMFGSRVGIRCRQVRIIIGSGRGQAQNKDKNSR
jgi:hypothetical protein